MAKPWDTLGRASTSTSSAGGGGNRGLSNKAERKMHKEEGLMFSGAAKKSMMSGKVDSMTKANTSKSRSATKTTVPVKKKGKK